MTREEAKAFLESVLPVLSAKMQLAIKALGQEPCEDAIRRADAINALVYDISIESDRGLDEYKSVIKEILCKIYDVQKANIEKLPSVTPQQKTGHWIKVHPIQTDDEGAYMCSCCKVGDWNLKGTENYCPNCGAKMSEISADSEKE